MPLRRVLLVIGRLEWLQATCSKGEKEFKFHTERFPVFAEKGSNSLQAGGYIQLSISP